MCTVTERIGLGDLDDEDKSLSPVEVEPDDDASEH